MTVRLAFAGADDPPELLAVTDTVCEPTARLAKVVYVFADPATAALSTVQAYEVGEPLVQVAVKALAVAPAVADGDNGAIEHPDGGATTLPVVAVLGDVNPPRLPALSKARTL